MGDGRWQRWLGLLLVSTLACGPKSADPGESGSGTSGDLTAGDPSSGGPTGDPGTTTVGSGPTGDPPPRDMGDDGADCPYPGGVVDHSVFLTTDDQVAELAGCTRVAGELYIEGRLISNLTPLHALEEVDGDLYVQTAFTENNPDANEGMARLTHLAGLDSLRRVGMTLAISNNPELTDISALANLTVTNQYIMIRDNDRLVDLHGLEGVTKVPVSVFIEDNPALKSLDGLENLASVPARVHVNGNDALVSTAGLQSLQGTGDLTIEGNGALTELVLPSLQAVDELTIARNDSLPTIGLVPAVGVADALTIILNVSLPQLDAEAWAVQFASNASHKIGGNLGDQSWEFMCPWDGDGWCDEPDLCGPGSDSDCP